VKSEDGWKREPGPETKYYSMFRVIGKSNPAEKKHLALVKYAPLVFVHLCRLEWVRNFY
jgi:hypothetical protein